MYPSMRTYFMTTQRLIFSRWGEGDLPLARQLWGDPAVTRYLSVKGYFTPEEIEARLAQEIQRDKDYGVQYWPLFLREGDDFVGCAGLRPYEKEAGVFELGFHLLPAFHRQGIAAEAGQAVLAFARENPTIQGVFAGHHPDNAASRKVLLRLGFTHVGDDFYAPTGLMHPAYRIDT